MTGNTRSKAPERRGPIAGQATYAPSGAPWRPTWVELAGWCALAGILALALLAHTGTAAFRNDGYQYLSLADNIRHGNGIKTSIIYYDIERSPGTIPAPMTTFPPGYSILTAIVSMAGISPEISAVGISLLSFALLPLIAGLTVPPGIRPWAFRTVMGLLAVNSSLLAMADSIATDALFTFVVAAAILCFSRALGTTKDSGLAWQICGWLLIGASYWIRYAGVFMVAGLIAFFSFEAVFRHGRRTLLHLSTSILALGAVGANMTRNAAISGSWRGGVAKRGIHLGLFSLRPLAVALYHALFGEPKAKANMGILLVAGGLAGLLFLAIRRWRQLRGGKPKLAPAYWMLWVLILAYCAGMVYADSTMVISFNTRYLVPLLPLLFLLAAYLLPAIESTAQKPVYLTCIALVLTGYFACHMRALIHYVPSVPHEEVLRAFGGGVSGGDDLTAWVNANLPPGGVITATDGQATAYALRRPTLCVIDPLFTSEIWDRSRLLKEMQRFQSDYLIIYPGLPAEAAPVQQESPLIRGLLAGRPSDGLQVAARNNSVIVLRRVRPQ